MGAWWGIDCVILFINRKQHLYLYLLDDYKANAMLINITRELESKYIVSIKYFVTLSAAFFFNSASIYIFFFTIVLVVKFPTLHNCELFLSLSIFGSNIIQDLGRSRLVIYSVYMPHSLSLGGSGIIVSQSVK